ncbi:MAG: glycosyltransferase family 2 protein [Desulfuromonadaceae bacterium]|nr:glycosyltransferase family 2 protein [Desulfuromonadaceae bacterium]
MPDKCLPPQVAAYLERRAVSNPWRINEPPSRSFPGAVVIPSLAESVNLPQTLHSLSENRAGLLSQFLILVVVNQRADASDQEKGDNLRTLEMLPKWKELYRLENLHWVDAAMPGMELPRKQGVGMARKIGLDLALRYLLFVSSDPLLVCLDADTLVQPDYLQTLADHFAGSSAGGASIPYRHRQADNLAGQAAIDRYELFLRTYVFGLEQAGSPYAFHTVGSAMACRASAYVSAGGMNRRLAGEDFYFLQQVHKTSGVETLSGTVVLPSPRSSHRVPFGTGRSVGEMLLKGEERLLFYQPAVFSILGDWLASVKEYHDADASLLLSSAALISPVLREFLEQAGFCESWENLKKNNREGMKFQIAFHAWFDAFRSMRLIHHLSDKAYPRIAPELAVSPLLERAGYAAPDTVAEQLELLRRLQGAY